MKKIFRVKGRCIKGDCDCRHYDGVIQTSFRNVLPLHEGCTCVIENYSLTPDDKLKPTVVSITGCLDCPLKRHHSGHGENWDYCTHPKAPETYEAILEREKTPVWCPLDEADYTIVKK